MERDKKRENDIAISDELLVKFLTGEALPDEAIAVEDWLTVGKNKAHFEKLEATWLAAYPLKNTGTKKKDQVWQALLAHLPSEETVGAKRISPRAFYYRAAALLAIVVVSGLAAFLLTRKNKPVTLRHSTHSLSEAVVLPDSSRVVLFQNSSISFPKHFKDPFREVELTSGEAFFSITADKEKPFIIHTAGADIRVVGTQFNVMIQADGIVVGVKEGSVLLATASDTSYLMAGSSGSTHASDGSIAHNSIINTNSWAYATGEFEFKNTPIHEVIRDLEKAFACSISVSNKEINNCKLTAIFENDSADKIINLIAETLNLSLQKNGGVFILEGDGCP